MEWQDVVLFAGNLVLSAALLPSLVGRDKPALSTAALTALVVLTFAVTFVSLELWLSAAAASLNAVLWLAIAFQQRPVR